MFSIPTFFLQLCDHLCSLLFCDLIIVEDFTCGPVVENLPVNAGDTGLIPSPGRFHML